jgi:hypothetical protein
MTTSFYEIAGGGGWRQVFSSLNQPSAPTPQLYSIIFVSSSKGNKLLPNNKLLSMNPNDETGDLCDARYHPEQDVCR